MIHTLEDFISKYQNIVNTGWITTHRSGPTGIGKTLEDLLGIPENNLHEPDFGEYELKSCRINSKSMLTMLHKRHNLLVPTHICAKSMAIRVPHMTMTKKYCILLYLLLVLSLLLIQDIH